MAPNGRFVFGTQYLRGLTPRRDDWERDFATMHALGINTVRAWLVWGVLEVTPEVVDLDTIEAFLALATRHDMQVGLLFHLHGCPEWAVRRHPEFRYVDDEGRAFEPSARANTPSGGWPGLCPDHAAVQDLEARFINTVAARFGTHPAVGFWEPINEPHQWIDLARHPHGVYCYCPATRAAFHAWLQRRYGTLAALGDAWGRRFGDWEDVRPPTWRFGFSDWCDWRTFQAEQVASLVARRATLIRAHSPRPVVGHAWGGGAPGCVDLGAMAFDDWKNAAPLDQWGYSAFPETRSATMLVGLGTDVTRGAAAGKPFWQAELGSGDYGSGLERRGRVPPAWLTAWSWESIRHGAMGLLYWQFRKEAHGTESGAYGLTDYGGAPTENARAVAEVGRVLNAHAALFHRCRPLPASVALVFSYQGYLMDWCQFRNCQVSADALGGYYRMFWEASIPVDILHEERLTPEALRPYRFVVLPMPLALVATARPALQAYIEAGGTVLSDPYLCAYDPAKALASEVPGAGFSAVFGAREVDITRPAANRPVPLTLADGSSGTIAHSHFQAFWEPLRTATVLARYDDQRPAIVANVWGDGRAILSGLNLGQSYASQEGVGDDLKRAAAGQAGTFARDLVLRLAREAGVNPPLLAPPGIVAGLLAGSDNEAILIALNMTEQAITGVIRFNQGAYASSHDLLSSTHAPFAGGELPVAFAACETKVLALT